MACPTNALSGISVHSSSDITSEQGLSQVVDQMIQKMKELEERDLSWWASYPTQPYSVDKDKPGNKRFVIQQPEITQEWRQGMKELLRQYLGLKFSEQAAGNNDEDIKSSTSSTSSVDEENECSVSSEIRFKIKVNESPSWYRICRNKKFDLVIQKDGPEKLASLSRKEELVFQEAFLARIFKGSHLEYISRFKEPCKMPDSFWSGWKTQMAAVSGLLSYLPQIAQRAIYGIGNLFAPITPSWMQYQNIIHPALREMALEILNSTDEDQPNIVEICGGEGELAVGIAERCDKPMNYYLLEYNDLSLERAKNLVASKDHQIQGTIIPVKTDITNDNDYFLDADKTEPMQNGSMDLIIGSGALIQSVLENKGSALAAARKCHELLKPNGKMILAGDASSFLDSEDFAALGFCVVNRSSIGGIMPFSTDVNRHIWVLGGWNKQFYVLEKIGGS